MQHCQILRELSDLCVDQDDLLNLAEFIETLFSCPNLDRWLDD